MIGIYGILFWAAESVLKALKIYFSLGMSCYLETNIFTKALLWKDNATSCAHWQSLELISLPAFFWRLFEVGKVTENMVRCEKIQKN